MSSKTKTTATKEEATPALVPNLRFPEFRDAGEWVEKKLGDVCEILNNRRRPITSSGRKPGPYRYYGASGVVDYVDDFIFDERVILVGEDGAKWGAFERTAFIVEGRFWVNNHAHVLQPKGVSDVLLTAYLSMTDLAPFVTGAAPPKLTLGKLKEIPVPIPRVESEDRAIADCLSSLDELLAAQARKVEALKTHKKGLMEQLFPREGETQPRLRFPEFRDAGEWEEYSLGQLVEIASGQVDPKQPPYSGLPQIGSENIESHSGELVNVKSAGEKGVISGNYGFDKSDILYSKIRPALNKVAAPSFNGICSADIYPIRPASGRLLRGYLFYLLRSQDFLDHAIRNSERGKIPKINRDALNCYKALIPSPTEQRRIADCLSSLDELIAAETRTHEALKTHKKGLMQQLFPSPQAMAQP